MHHRPWRTAPLTAALLTLQLTACGGGGSGAGGNQPADPVQEDIPIAYIKRPLPTEGGNANTTPTLRAEDLLHPEDFRPGARLVVRARATPDAQEKIITDRVYGADALYDVKDLELSYDGTRLLFSMRAPELENVDPDEQPTWDIWEYNLKTDDLHRVIKSDVTEAQGQDVNPRYLPDGRIVFASTRQITTKATMLDEGKPQYNPQGESGDRDMFAVHVMNGDGSNIRQITFNTSHEIQPVVNTNGEIIYSRWDNAGSHDQVDLYSIRPDGTQQHHLYGSHSHNTGTDGGNIDYRHLQPAPDGRFLAMIGPRRQSVYGGNLIYLDPNNFSDNDQPVSNSTSSSSTAQVAATHFPIRTNEGISLGGYISAAYPLWDGSQRLLISWSECRVKLTDQVLPCTEERVATTGATIMDPAYGLWMYQASTQSVIPIIVPAADRVYTDIVVMQPRTMPPQLPTQSPDIDTSLIEENVGILHIRSVYDIDGVFNGLGSGAGSLATMRQLPPAQRSARFVRLEKAVWRTSRDVSEVPNEAFGVAGGQHMRDILGYAPIEPDGSVKVKVTANVPFTLSLLDTDGRAISIPETQNHDTSTRHSYWLQVAPGETLECNGCHAPNSTAPHGRPDARAASINSGAANNVAYAGLNAAYIAQTGETMAETRVRVDQAQNPMRPSADLVYNDVWLATEPERTNASFSRRYAFLDPDLAPDTDTSNDDITLPTNASCAPVWTSLCRVTLHYPTHIAPIWTRTRNRITDEVGAAILDGDGNPVDQCTDCHKPGSDVFGDLPTGVTPSSPRTQLDLTNDAQFAGNDFYLNSYGYLFLSPRAKQYNVGNVLEDEVLLDDNGDPLCALNDDGTPNVNPDTGVCNEFQYVNVRAAMSGNGARASKNFFAPFKVGGTHYKLHNWLNPVELKMISEWLDIGAQYYNDPFAVPQG